MTQEELTFNEHVNAALAIVQERRQESMARSRADDPTRSPENKAQYDAAARDFSLSITHLEDGLTRFNSGCYRQAGRWHRNDPDKTPE